MRGTRDLIFPMKACDLVVSAVIVGQEATGSGPRLALFEVVDVEVDPGAGPSRSSSQGSRPARHTITVKDGHGGTAEFVLAPETPILITGISRE